MSKSLSRNLAHNLTSLAFLVAISLTISSVCVSCRNLTSPTIDW
ncbi:unnamed protein product [Rhodiola kirilowii]